MTDTIFLIVIFLLETLLFYFLPTLGGERTLFGIVLKNDDFQTYGFPILRKYRRDLLIGAVGSLIGLYLLGRLSANSLVVAYIAATFGILFSLFKYQRQTWRLRDKRTISRLASPLKPRLLRDFSNLWLETAVILLPVAPFAVLAFYYPHLPNIVPIHWNIAGEADGWAQKNFSSVFFLPVLAAYLQVFWIILKQDIIRARFRVPAEQAEQVLSLKEISLQASVGMVDWCRLFCGVLLGTVSLLILSPVVSPSVTSALNISTWANLILLLAGMAFYMYRMVLASREIKSLTGQITFQTFEEMQGWTDGLFYYNPKDAAFMVEKPGGVGYTINFAHKRAILYLALILLPMLMSILSLFSMKRG
jgi:uncharacterized membrane protein